MFKIPFSGFVTPRGDCANLWGRWRFVFHLEKIFPFQWSPEVSKICRWNNSAQLIIVAKIYPFGKNKSVWNKYFHLEQVLSFGRNIFIWNKYFYLEQTLLFGTNISIWNKYFHLEQIFSFVTNIFILNNYFHLEQIFPFGKGKKIKSISASYNWGKCKPANTDLVNNA